MPDITFNCQRCGQRLVIEAAGAGLSVPCPTCATKNIVPSGEPLSLGDQPTMKAQTVPPVPPLDVSVGDQPTQREAPELESGLGRIDRYLIQRQLGRGGFGAVWQARDVETGLDVALKALPSMVSANPDELMRVRNNFALVSRLTHPSICALRYLHKVERTDKSAESNLGLWPGSYLVVMDYVEGVTLTQYRLQRGGQLPPQEAALMAGSIADALDYAHSQKVLHRDIKPGNIMVARHGPIKLLDFGLAAEIRSSMGRQSREITDTSGTRPYMAPEQWLGQKQETQSDQYALAAVLYELVTGSVPLASAFETNDPVIMLNAVKSEHPEPVEGLSPAANAALTRALAKTRQDRYASCRDFIEAFKAGLQGEYATVGESRPGPAVKEVGQKTAAVSEPEPVPQVQQTLGVSQTESTSAIIMGPLGKTRSVPLVILFTIVTLGLYPLFWVRRVIHEAYLFAHGRNGVRMAKGATLQAALVLSGLLPVLGSVWQRVYPDSLLDLLVLPGAILYFACWSGVARQIRKMRIAAGVPPKQAGHPSGSAVMLVVPIIGYVVYVGYLQHLFNKIWREQLAARGRNPNSRDHDAKELLQATTGSAFADQVPARAEEHKAPKWHYAHRGERKGPVSENDIQQLIAQGIVTEASSVWGGGGDWTAARQTALARYFNASVQSDEAPPLKGKDVDNLFAWAIAITPVVWGLIDYTVSWSLPWQAYWFANAAICFFDGRRLRAAGHKAPDSWAAALLPVYLWQRGRRLAQFPLHACIWVALYGAMLLVPTWARQPETDTANPDLRAAALAGDANAAFSLGQAYENGEGVPCDDKEAFFWYQKSADLGHKDAINNLGTFYAGGRAVASNQSEALRLYLRAAESGSEYGAYNLGVAYYNGQGVSPDLPAAAAWFHKAAERGHGQAAAYLGWMYEGGWGVATNYEESANWYRKAAEQGLADAQYNLGRAYVDGRGVAANNTEALDWYRKAAEQGHADAQLRLGLIYDGGIFGVDENVTEAAAWYRKAAEQGHADAQNLIGMMHELGRGVTANSAEAFAWHRKAAEQGHADAQNRLGSMYESGWGVATNLAEAVFWYRKAAEQGESDSQYDLGRAYFAGRGVATNRADAAKWCRKAAEKGNAKAQTLLGLMYAGGLGVARNDKEAVAWYRKAAEQGDAKAQNQLGLMYEGGLGVPKNYAAAANWYRKAAEQGNVDAKRNLNALNQR